MRDPGRPRRNPFFEPEDPDAPLGSEPSDDPFDAWRDAIEPDRAATLLGALAEVQPEAAAHLVAAAHELVLAVKTVVDAAEAALAVQRVTMAERSADATQPAPADAAPGAGGPADDAGDPAPAAVHRIADLA